VAKRKVDVGDLNDFGQGAPRKKERKCSFLKKRTKKLLSVRLGFVPTYAAVVGLPTGDQRGKLMSMRYIVVGAAFLGWASAARATTISGSYTAVDTGTGSYLPTINYDGNPFLTSPFSESLSVGVTTTPTTFLQVAPVSGSASAGTQTGGIKIGLTLSDSVASTITGVSYSSGGNGATLSGQSIQFLANYEIFYGSGTDCLTWNSATCTPSSSGSSPGETLTVSFSDGAVLAINLYDWSNGNMTPQISFDLVSAATPASAPVPEPASIAVFAAGLLGLGLIWRRFPQGRRAVEAEA
jgi:hypothetical protein